MLKRLFRRTTFILHHRHDIGRLAWRVLLFWKVPRIEIRTGALPLLDAQRTQLRLRQLGEVLERRSGAMVAVAVLIIGLADMVRTWNRDLGHMAWLVGLALVAGLAARLLGRTWIRLRILFVLLRLRRRICRAQMQPATKVAVVPPAQPVTQESAPPAGVAPADVDAPARPASAAAPLQGSCCCGAVTFTLTRRPLMMGTCHCSRCRKSGASTFVLVRRDALLLASGTEAIGSCAPHAAHRPQQSFCTRCGTPLGEITAASHEIALPAHLLDAVPGVRNGFHEFVSEKPDWYAICDAATQFPQQRPAAG